MVVHSFHLASLPPTMTARALVRPPSATDVPGLRHAECLATMELGSPTVSPARMQLRRLALFAEWESPTSLDDFLASHCLGRRVADGWHVRLQFLRRWGQIAAMRDLPTRVDTWGLEDPVVAVTLARMKLLQVPRFLKWGKPVERLVRDHPGTTLALAAMRPPRTICTFSVWHTVREMTDMVHGHSHVPNPQRHAVAMQELRRKGFHHEFVTLRFRPLSEHGEWEGRRDIVPGRRGRP